MKDSTEIAVVIDESGSMDGLTDETISSFNKFLADQQALPGDATMTITLFNTNHRQLCVGKPLKEVKPLGKGEYKANGYTALLDAIGITIDTVGKKLAEMSEAERPNKVVVVIITDGEENSSKEYKPAQIKAKVEEQQSKYAWVFLFLGANIDAFKVGSAMGVPQAQVAQYAANAQGLRGAYGQTSHAVASVRSGGSSSLKRS